MNIVKKILDFILTLIIGLISLTMHLILAILILSPFILIWWIIHNGIVWLSIDAVTVGKVLDFIFIASLIIFFVIAMHMEGVENKQKFKRFLIYIKEKFKGDSL